MKVAVITRHAIANYGSILQAIATQQVIEDMGHICEIIDYVRTDETYFQREKTLLVRKTKWNNSFIRRIIYLALRQPESIVAGKYFEKAQKKYLNITERYSDIKQLENNKPIADIYMTGSDQVWGPVENGSYDSSYCLSFTNEADKRIAYAASFGHTDMNPETERYYKKWLRRYKYITVREDSAVEFLKRIGIESLQVMDPTLLLDKTAWNAYTKPIKQKKYVLVYQLHNDNRVGIYADKVAKAMGLQLVRISVSFHQIGRKGKFVWCPEISEFLSYIKYAECVITDSFHGTAFAINFNVSFVEVLPNNNTGTRNLSILKMLDLSERILGEKDDILLAQKKIDFLKVNKILEKKRRESLDILKQMIEN